MAYRRKYVKRKWNRRKQTLTTKVDKLMRITRMNKPELKYVDAVNNTGTNCDWNGLTYVMNTTTQGSSDYSNRVGDQYKMKYFNIKWSAALADTSEAVLVRCIIFVCKEQPDAIIPDASQLNLVLDSAFLGTYNAVNAYKDHDNAHNYKILHDSVHKVTAYGATDGLARKSVNIRIPNSVSTVGYYSGGGAGYTVRNKLFVAFISNVSTSGPTIRYVSRLQYIDP